MCLFLAVVPARETPLMFAHPHVMARFSGAGKLISVVPSLYSRCVEINSIKVSESIITCSSLVIRLERWDNKFM